MYTSTNVITLYSNPSVVELLLQVLKKNVGTYLRTKSQAELKKGKVTSLFVVIMLAIG